MSDEPENHEPQELTLVAHALDSVVPVSIRIDRDRLMFLAGQASVSASGGRPSREHEPPEGHPSPRSEIPARLLWPAASAALAATSLALAIALAWRGEPAPQIVIRERIVTVAAPAAAPAIPDRQSPAPPQAALAGRSLPPEPPANDFLRTREVALRLGLDAIGRPPRDGQAAAAVTYGDWMESLFPSNTSGDRPHVDRLPQL